MKTIVPLTLRLNGADRIALLAHFLALDPEDRRLRFGAAVADEVIGQYVERLDLGRDGLFAVRDDDDGLAAVVHVAIGDSTGELGLSVLPAHRGHGHAVALLGEATRTFQAAGCSSALCDTGETNRPMVAALRRAGYREHSRWQRKVA